MATIREQIIAIKVSTLVKDENSPEEVFFTDEVVETVEAVVGEILGSGKIVEVIRDL